MVIEPPSRANDFPRPGPRTSSKVAITRLLPKNAPAFKGKALRAARALVSPAQPESGSLLDSARRVKKPSACLLVGAGVPRGVGFPCCVGGPTLGLSKGAVVPPPPHAPIQRWSEEHLARKPRRGTKCPCTRRRGRKGLW